MTTSENLFENFCRTRELGIERIPESSSTGIKSADFQISSAGSSIVVEIAQFDPNDQDKIALNSFARSGHAFSSDTPGRRVRKAIEHGGPKLRPAAASGSPTLLVIYDNTDVRDSTGSYDVLTGMYGLEAELVEVPHDPAEKTRWLGRGVAGKRKMTPNQNTSISAVGSLYFSGEERVGHLAIFHNVFARIRIAPETLRAERIYHFTLPKTDGGFRMEWEKIDP
jgi:hypothetical protein